MRAALALCVVQALISLPALCHYDETFTENYETRSLCKKYPYIEVYGSSGCNLYNSETNKGANRVHIAYGTEVKAGCIGTGANEVTISWNGKKLIELESYGSLNGFTTKLNSHPPEHVITCTDIETACERSVIIIVTPGLEVISSYVEPCIDCYHTFYFIPYGNSASVLCSGPDAARLVVSKDGKALPTERKNETTINSIERTPGLQSSKYVCTDVSTTYNSSVIVARIPKIWFQSRNETITPYYMHHGCFSTGEMYFEYRGAIEVFCSGPRAVTLIGQESNGDEYSTLLTENFNVTTVYINITKLGTSIHKCSDSSSDYIETRVKVIIVPRMEVMTPSVPLIGHSEGVREYSIAYRQSVEIICSGPDAFPLTISGRSGTVINGTEETVNTSTIKYIINEADWYGVADFTCTEPGGNERNQPRIRIGMLPAVKNFRCFSLSAMYFNCSWTAINYNDNYTIYYVENEIRTHIMCENVLPWQSQFCFWYPYGVRKSNKVHTFLIQSCYFVGCYNQTFHFDHFSIVKLEPPERLKVLRTTSRGAVLQWSAYSSPYINGRFVSDYENDFHRKVQYWYPGIEPRDVNSSLICDWDCEIELSLPCPNQFYEVRIYHKLKRTAGDEFWSDPSSITFYTDSENDKTIVIDPTCYQEPRKTKEVMTYFVQELRQDLRNEIQLTERIFRSLQDKLAKIHKYLAGTKQQED